MQAQDATQQPQRDFPADAGPGLVHELAHELALEQRQSNYLLAVMQDRD
jgi:hypothetical protein